MLGYTRMSSDQLQAPELSVKKFTAKTSVKKLCLMIVENLEEEEQVWKEQKLIDPKGKKIAGSRENRHWPSSLEENCCEREI